MEMGTIEREGVILFSAGGEREKRKKKKRRSLLWFERERNREMKMTIFEF